MYCGFSSEWLDLHSFEVEVLLAFSTGCLVVSIIKKIAPRFLLSLATLAFHTLRCGFNECNVKSIGRPSVL